MPKLSGRMLWAIVAGLIGVQMVLTLVMVHRESLTFDEGDHMFAGYMMWHIKDYGLNPEHPPFVKLLATTPLLGRALWVPELKGRDFKTEAYLDGRDWLARNDGDRNQLVFEMRAAAGLLAVALSLVIFLMARESFGDWAGIFALTLAAFDPNVLAHSALVTTDIAARIESNFEISIDGQKISGAAPNTGDYTKFQSTRLDGVLEISAPGEVTISVKPVKANWSPINLKSVKLTPTSAGL